jgi:hypothetical protein
MNYSCVHSFCKESRSMSVEKFLGTIASARIHENDAEWFPRWIRRYASFLKAPVDRPLLVSHGSVIAFCRALLTQEVPAWQRLQAVRAIEFYRTEVLRSFEPDLLEIKRKLGIIAESERRGGESSVDEKSLIGVIHPPGEKIPERRSGILLAVCLSLAAEVSRSSKW